MKKLRTTSVRFADEEEESLFVSPARGDDGDDDGANGVDGDANGGGEEDQNEKSHARLLSDMRKISRRKTEISRDVRTSLGAGGTVKVDTNDILKRLGNSSLSQSNEKIRSLPKPVEKTVARRSKRAAGFEKVAIEVNKWENLVHIRRKSDQLTFPLERADIRVKTQDEADQFKPRTPLEQEVYALLNGAKLVEEKKETEEERATKRAVSLQQVKERNREMWHQRENKRRYERKAMMQNKSKSKKHHRLLRRERLKRQKTELEELHKTDPEAALEMIEELERLRVQERMSLRHKTSKWAHLQGHRATRDKGAMAALKENQRMHRELTAKVAAKTEDDEDDDLAEMEAMLKKRQEAIEGGTYNPLNPWIKDLKKGATQGEFQGAGGNEDGDESFTKFKKFWEEVNRRNLVEKKIQEEMDKREEGEVEEEGGEEEEGGKDDEEEDEESEMEQEEELGKCDKEEEEDQLEEVGEKEQEEGGKEEEEKPTTSKENKDKRKRIKKIKPTVNKKRKSTQKHKTTTEATSPDKTTTEATSPDKTTTEPTSPDKQRNDPTAALISVDEMFDEAEIGIRNKVKRKLEKMGIHTKNDGGNWEKVKRKRRRGKKPSKNVPVKIEEFDFTCNDNKDNIDEKLERARTLEDMDDLQVDGGAKHLAVDVLKRGTGDLSRDSSDKNGTRKKVEVDPTKFIEINTKKLATLMPDNVSRGEEALDDDESDEVEDPEEVIREAFADDYLIDEFKSEKAAAIEKDGPKTLSLAIPGWGDWTGPNIKMSKRKLMRFRVRTPRKPRKDSTMGNVIYNETADVHDNLRKAMVSDLPFPFRSVRDFEASIRAPVGRAFVPEATHKKLTKPPLITKMGKVIEPMTEDELLRNKRRGPSTTDKRGRGGGKPSDSGSSRVRITGRGKLPKGKKRDDGKK